MEILQTTPDCEIISTRTVPFPADTVFEAWSNPVYLKEWWGPFGFTNTFQEFDFREGGTWRFIMHGPDRGNYANECVFIKIERPYLIAWDRNSQPLFQIVAMFDEVPGNQTKITFKMLFRTAEECSKIRSFAPEKNEENFDRMEKVLTRMNQ